MKRLLAFLVLGVFACAGGPPLTFDSASQRPPGDAQRCVAQQVEDEGFTITETDDGALQAVGVYERPDTSTFLGLETVERLIEWGRIDALFERNSGSTSIRYTAATSSQRDGPWRDPSRYMAELAEDIAGACE